MKAILVGLVVGITLSASTLIVNDCGGNNYTGTCFVSGGGGGFGTTVYSVAMTAMGANYSGDPRPAGSGSVTLNDIGIVSGTGTGYIEFFDYDMTGIAYNVFGGASASFSVGSVTGSIPGNDRPGLPQPYAGQLTPFALGTPFDISAAVSFEVGPSLSVESETGYGSAVLDFSFSVYGGEQNGYPLGAPLVIEDASSGPAAPEPGTAALGGLVQVLMLGMRKITGAAQTPARKAPAVGGGDDLTNDERAKFYSKRGLWPTRADAMAHCSDQMQRNWTEELEKIGRKV